MEPQQKNALFRYAAIVMMLSVIALSAPACAQDTASAPPETAQSNGDMEPSSILCTVNGEQRELPTRTGACTQCDADSPVYHVIQLETVTGAPPPKVPQKMPQPSTEGGRD